MLGQLGEDARNSKNVYKVVIQSTLLFGLETWVKTLWIGRNLRGFHYRVDRFFGGDATAIQCRGAVGVSAFGKGNGGSRPEGGGDIRPLPPEKNRPVHLDIG